jgi:hypothetical protein
MRADHGASALAISKVDGEIAGVGERYGRPRGGEVVAGRQASEKRRQHEGEKRRQREGEMISLSSQLSLYVQLIQLIVSLYVPALYFIIRPSFPCPSQLSLYIPAFLARSADCYFLIRPG